MVFVIVAGALGVSIITGGLFLRRLLGEIAELRRQITGIDRQMRAQRAHVTFLRQLLTEDDAGDGPPSEAAVVNGNADPPNFAYSLPGPEPVRRKRHLGLYLGGAVAAIATVSSVARDALHGHRVQIISALVGAAATATTVTVVSVQPWTDNRSDWPTSAPAVSAPSPRPPTSPPPPPPSGGPPSPAVGPWPSQDATASGSPAATLSPSAIPRRPVLPTRIPVGEGTPVAETSLPSSGSSDGGSLTEGAGLGLPQVTPSPPTEPATQSPPPGEAVIGPVLDLNLSVGGLIIQGACLLC